MTHQSTHYRDPNLTIRRDRFPLHAMLMPFPTACFVGALLTDGAYWKTADMMWANFSAWLISAGVVLWVITAIVGIVGFLLSRHGRDRRGTWMHAIGTILVLVIATANMFIHTRDAWTSVVPWGIALSALTTVILILITWFGWSLTNRDRVGVAL